MTKPSDFTDEETTLLRRFTRELMEERGWSGAELGRHVGIKQQNISRFAGEGAIGGPSRGTANAIAQLAGFSDSEQLLLELKVKEGAVLKKGNVWAARDSARRIAQALGYADGAIGAVVERSKDAEFAKKEVRWWIDEIVLEALRQDAGRVRR